ncbi:MAG: helix-turn-helix domain-containing protein [Leptolyngbya sp. BL-A-14]
MLAHESTYCVSVPGGNAEVSLNGLRAILGQVETELHHSEIYGQMLSSLKALPDDLNRQMQSMMRAMGREAIRLALRKMVRKKPSGMVQATEPSFANAASPTAAPKVQPLTSVNPSVAVAADRTPPTLTVVPPTESQRPTDTRERKMLYPPTAVSSIKPLKTNPHKKLSKRELAEKAVFEAREAYLRDLGQMIRQVRQERSWSPYHLHLKTQVPLHQLEALETGRLERLPEDIYLQGFIRQIGNALGLDGNHMAASLPTIASAVVPSWQQPKAGSKLRINSMQIYLGYAALMAGGIAWVSHQSIPQRTEPASPSSSATVVPLPKASPTQATAAKANPKGAATSLSIKQGTSPLPGNVSPPETNPL